MSPTAQIAAARSALQAHLNGYMTSNHIQEVMRACDFAEVAHAGVTRKSGEPYITHPIAVAQILTQLHVDSEGIQAALLHDVIEDTDYDKAAIESDFGAVVAELVDGLTKLDHLPDKALNQAATFGKIIAAIVHDPRVLVIKLADRLHNMSTLDAMRPDKQQRIARETLDYYLPLARLAGLNDLGDQLEKYCWAVLEPETTRTIQRLRQQHNATSMGARQAWMDELIRLARQAGIRLAVMPLDNELALYRGFLEQHWSLDELLHQFSFELILESVTDCDRMADLLAHHFPWSQQQDHIRTPLPGGLQALYMQVKNEAGHQLSLTLQTARMQAVARRGLTLGEQTPQMARLVIQASLRNLAALIDPTCPTTTYRALGQYLQQEKIWVYTPKGMLIELPQGACVIDFAYAVSHTLGAQAVAAELAGKTVPLETPLHNGQTVIIITDAQAMPQPDWLGVAVTPKARRYIQQWLRAQPADRRQQLGEQALHRALQWLHIESVQLDDADWQDWQAWQQVDSRGALFERIATGELLPQLVALRWQQRHQQTSSAQSEHGMQYEQVGLIDNLQGVNWHLGRCCHPILGDGILGHLTQRGLVVHRQTCRNAVQEVRRRPQHIIGLKWTEHPREELRFTVPLQIQQTVTDESLSDVIDVVQEAEAAVADFEHQTGQALLHVIVKNRDQLARVLRDVRAVLGFPQVQRLAAN